MSHLAIRASSLSSFSDKGIADEIIKGICNQINVSIASAHRSGKNSVRVRLPSQITINNMSLGDAQTLVYSEIIDIYTRSERENGGGFDSCAIETDETHHDFIVSWKNGMSRDERATRFERLKKHTTVVRR